MWLDGPPFQFSSIFNFPSRVFTGQVGGWVALLPQALMFWVCEQGSASVHETLVFPP